MSVPTPLTEMLGIDHPIMCAGMGRITGAELGSCVGSGGPIWLSSEITQCKHARQLLLLRRL